MKHGARKLDEFLKASLISALAVNSLACGVHDCFEGDNGAIEYCTK